MNDKIQNLLDKAEQQKQSSENRGSSITSASRDCNEISEAEDLFVRLKQKLFHVRQWNGESGLSSFEIFDEDGKLLSERESVIVGDFIRITLTGSGKADWVKIVEITDEADEAVITVKPSYNPTEKTIDKNATSHFYTTEASNNFCLGKDGQIVSVYVIGLDEVTNTEETENLVEKVRNFATSNIGYYFGVQKIEWKTFCENFLEVKE